MAATRQALKRSNFSFREDGSSNRRIPNLYAGSTTSQLPPFRKKDARNLAEACLSPDETENAGITKSPVLFYKKTGNARDFMKKLGNTALREFRRRNEKTSPVSRLPFRNAPGAARVHPQQKPRSCRRRSIKKLRSRQVHAQTLTTAELRLHTLIHPTKIIMRSFSIRSGGRPCLLPQSSEK